MQPTHTGLGLLQAWLWLTFMNGPLLYEARLVGALTPEKVFVTFLAVQSGSFLMVALAGLPTRRFLRKHGHWLAAIAATLGTAALVIPPHAVPQAIRAPVVGMSAALSGAGGAFLLVGWGYAYSSLPVRVAGAWYAGSVVGGTLLFLASNVASPSWGIALASACACASAVCLVPALGVEAHVRRLESAETGGGGSDRTGHLAIPNGLAVSIVLVYCAGGCMYRMVFAGSESMMQVAYWVTNVAYACTVLAVTAAVWAFPDVDLRFMYRLVLPLLGAGFVLHGVLPSQWLVAPFVLLQAGFAVFDAFTWLVLAYLSARHAQPSRVIGSGMFLVTVSVLAGECGSSALLSLLPASAARADYVSILGALTALGATVLLPDSKETFAGWSLREEGVGRHSVPARFNEGQPGDAWAQFESLVAGFSERHALTPRETEIISLLLRGRNNPYIREELNISNNTLKTHLRNIYQKAGLHSRQELMTLFACFDGNTGERGGGRHPGCG